MKDWRQLKPFAGITLDHSFVVGWSLDGETLAVELDLVLDRTHPFYETPRPAERECFRQGRALFPYCQSINGEATSQFDTKILSMGRVEQLLEVAEGRYEIRGEFGTVIIEAEEPALEIRSAS